MTLAQIQSELGLTERQARRWQADRRKAQQRNRTEFRKSVRRNCEQWGEMA